MNFPPIRPFCTIYTLVSLLVISPSSIITHAFTFHQQNHNLGRSLSTTTRQIKRTNTFRHPLPHLTPQIIPSFKTHSTTKHQATTDINQNSQTPLQTDNNGNGVVEGATVRITKTIRAYHVPKKGFGSFDETTKKFVPIGDDGDDITRKDKCMVIPPGMTAVVKRVYDTDDSDASHPVEVTFVTGGEGDYESPVRFNMHLRTDEVECVVE